MAPDQQPDRAMRWLGIAHIVFSTGVTVYALALLAPHWLWADPANDPLGISAAIVRGLTFYFALSAVFILIPGLVGGIGLIRGKALARKLVLLASVAMLPLLPIGTGFGGVSLALLLARRRSGGDAN